MATQMILNENFTVKVSHVQVLFSGHGHWNVTVELTDLETLLTFEVSKKTTNSIAVDNKEYITLAKEVLEYHYEDNSDVDFSYIQNS